MGNTHVKPHPRTRNKKQVRWKAAGPLIKCFGDSRLPSFDLARPLSPGKPQLSAEVNATPDLITVCWAKPSGDGGSPISGYLVEHRRLGSPHWVRASPLLVQIPEITISGLEPGWRYQFRVRAENAVGLSDPSELSEPITVTLQRSAITAPRFTQELQDVVALENEKAEFVVHFLGQPAPKVCWYKDGFEIFSSRRIRILTESDRSVLTIHQTALSDEGEIKCTATNRAGHISTKSALAVEAPPSIRLPRQYEEGLLFEIGEMIRLKVSVAGRPTPLVFWSHNGESIKNNDRYEVEYIDRSSVLKINEARRNDRGEYQVKAVNKLGENTQSFLVTVTDKPSPPGKARVIMALGRSVTLSWTPPHDDGGCKIGNYIVEYYRLGWNVWLKAATSRQFTTILGDLIEGSEYKFRIKAESPYGVSDPSEESEVIFIPDPKRGILEPQLRGRSQPREVPKRPDVPVAIQRRNKPRSQSSSRVETNVNLNTQNSNIPIRPERTKIKSPPKTPEMSPRSNRKESDLQMHTEIFEPSDRSSIARDLAYGSPEIKVKKEPDVPPNHINMNFSRSSEKSKTPSPTADKEINHKVYTVKIEPPRSPSPAKISRSPSPDVLRTKSPRENNENFTGSSEFMLVLYPDENERGHSDFDFDENSVPPPMSLSAPELGAEPPFLLNSLKNSASSTELLHERAMMRFYRAAEAEEAELEKRRKANKNKEQFMDIPKIQINSKDDQDIVGLERQNSFRRRMSAGGISHQQAAWAQRRHSLRGPTEGKGEIQQNKLYKFPIASDLKREMTMNRQRSESEEREDQAFEEVRQRMMLETRSSNQKRQIAVADVEKWADDYESSTESESDLSDDAPPNEQLYRRSSYEDEEEKDTYHPGSLRTEPFEILSKRKDLPDPNFIPKPILKKSENEEHPNHEILPAPSSPQNTIKPPRSSSPRPQNITQRERSQSLVEEGLDIQAIKNKFQPKTLEISRPRSFSLLPQNELLKQHTDNPQKPVFPEETDSVSPGPSITAVAQISGITAASIVIPNKLLEKREAEEAKVVIDHYGDIVKNFGKRNKSNPPMYFDRDSLKKVAQNIDTPQTDIEENSKTSDNPYMYQKAKPENNEPAGNYDNSYQRSSFTDHYDSKPRKDILKSQPTLESIHSAQQQTPLRNYHEDYYRSSTFAPQYDSKTRKDSLKSQPDQNTQTLQDQAVFQNDPTDYYRNSNFTDHYDINPRKDGLRSQSDNQNKHAVQEETSLLNDPDSRSSSFIGYYDNRQRRDSVKSQPDNQTAQIQTTLHNYDNYRSNSLTGYLDSISLKSNPDRSKQQLESENYHRRSSFTDHYDSLPRKGNMSNISQRRQSAPQSKEAILPPIQLTNKNISPRDSPSRSKFELKSENWKMQKSPVIPKPKRKTSPSPMRTGVRRKISPSPMRKEMRRKTSPSPVTKEVASSRRRSKSPSPVTFGKRRPMLREIMTQTSVGLESPDRAASLRSSTAGNSQKQEELMAKAEVQVRSAVDYITDLAMFIVACWLYLFKNELLAIPVLLVMVYRQLQAEIAKRIPKWIVRRLRKKRKQT